MTKKRDARYYKARLAKEHPAIFAEIRPGGLSVRQANAKAGLIHLPTRLDALKRDWKRASEAQQVEFVRWLKTGIAKRVARRIVDAERRLQPDVARFLANWVKTNNSKPGRIMK